MLDRIKYLDVTNILALQKEVGQLLTLPRLVGQVSVRSDHQTDTNPILAHPFGNSSSLPISYCSPRSRFLHESTAR